MNSAYRIYCVSMAVFLMLSTKMAVAAPDEFKYGKLLGYPAGDEMANDYIIRFRVGGFSGKQLVKRGTTKTTIKPSEAPQKVTSAIRNDWPSEFNPEQLLNNSPMMALILIQGNNIVYESYQYGTSASSTFNSESMAKTLTALVIGVLLDEGLIKSLDNPISEYVPEFIDVWFGKNTIKNLLQMQCGLDGASAGATGARYANIKFGPTASLGAPALNLYEYIKKLPMTSQPGTQWVYDPVCSDALSMVVTKVTGKLLAEVFQEKIWGKLETEHPAYWAKATATEITSGANQFWAKPHDYAKIAILLANQGSFNGKQIISTKYMNALTNDYVRQPNTRYGAYTYQTWKHTSESGASANGYLGQRIIFDTVTKNIFISFSVDDHDKASQPFWKWFNQLKN
jgi:CubicO group peptidase (beta-lactamase class C family)